MQDANTQVWTESKARAETVALGRAGGDWTAPVPPDEAFNAGMAPKALSVHAEANHGRWIVVCPDCSGAQYACPDDPRFMCNNCANVVIAGLWRRVIWPKEREMIDTLLRRRPEKNRNWSPGETLADLRRENKANGVA